MFRLLSQYWFGFLFVAGVLLLALIPVESVERGPVICLYRNLFGVECLFCGMTRALSCLLHGRLADAATHNRLVFAVLPLGFGLAMRDFKTAVRRFRDSRGGLGRRVEEVV